MAKTTFTRPSAGTSSTASLNGGTMPVMGGDALFEAVLPLVVAQHLEVVVGQAGDVVLDDGPDARPLVAVGQPQAARPHARMASSHPARLKMK